MTNSFQNFILICFTLLVSSCQWPTTGSSTVQLTSAVATAAAQGISALGRQPHFNVVISDAANGVCQAQAYISQGAVKIPLPLPTAATLATAKPKNWTATIDSLDLSTAGFQEGTAEISVAVQNCSIFKGKSNFAQNVTLDFTPPRVELTSSQHYINQAGAEVATYTVSDDAVWSGVVVGPNTFKGYVMPGATSPADHFAFFVYSYNLPSGTPIEIKAIDAAGNERKTTLSPAKFFAKEFRHRDIPIDDHFIETKVADIISNTPGMKSTGDALSDFLAVNRDLRKINTQFLLDLAQKSEEKFYWKDAFRPLYNAAIEASFADYRSYFYHDEKIDEQVHLGFDMAVVERNPILAAAAGKILFAGYFGIYGNTVVIDHGYGITTL